MPSLTRESLEITLTVPLNSLVIGSITPERDKRETTYDCCNFLEPGHSAGHASDGDRYTIMTYGNGAGFNANKAEVDDDYELYIQRGPVPEESLDYGYKFPSSAPLSSETHGGDDVGIWAIGIYIVLNWVSLQ